MNTKNFGIISGRLTSDITVKTGENNSCYGYGTIAVQRSYKNKSGEYDTDFFFVSFSGKTAEFAAKYFKKGSPIIASYALQTKTAEGADGKKITSIVIQINEVDFPLTAAKHDGNNEGAKMPIQQNPVGGFDGSFTPLPINEDCSFETVQMGGEDNQLPF